MAPLSGLLLLQLFFFTGVTASRIVGGRVARPHSRPYMVSLQVGDHHICGGILIQKDFVLTSAHCKQHVLFAVLGAHNITKREQSQQRIEVAEFHPHPEYICKYDYDIMLLKLKTDAKLNSKVKIIALPKKDDKIPDKIMCSVAGWGMTEGRLKKSASDVLREANVQLQLNFECKKKWESSYSSEQMLCTYTDKHKGICQGDSGGPLICDDLPMGISAFTSPENCVDSKYPPGFIKISYFVDWIEEVISRGGNVALSGHAKTQ